MTLSDLEKISIRNDKFRGMPKVILPLAPRLDREYPFFSRQIHHPSQSNLPRQLSALSPIYGLNKLKLMAYLNKLPSKIRVRAAFSKANLLEQKLEVLL